MVPRSAYCHETRLLLSLTNAGAQVDAQAARELVAGIYPRRGKHRADDVFELLAWNQGIGFFQQRDRPLGAVPGVQAH